jgi:DNA-binding protein HU-beta
MNISKAQLIKEVAMECGCTHTDAKKMIDATLDRLTHHLAEGNDIQLTGFGTFEVRERQARMGVRPGTTEKINIPASKYPAFKAGKNLKGMIAPR